MSYKGDTLLKNNHQAYQCTADIINCASYDPARKLIYCQECKPRYYRSTNDLACLKQQDTCKKMVDKDCTECVKDYHLSNFKEQDKPTQCIEDIDDCDLYNDKDKECALCKESYHLSVNRKACFKSRVPSCYKYKDKICDQCLKGYKLEANEC